MNPTDTRQHVHSLVDRLVPVQLAAIEELLSVMLDPIAHALANAPKDDEPLTQEEEQAIRYSEAWFEKHGGAGIPMEEVLGDFGVSRTDFPPHKRAD